MLGPLPVSESRWGKWVGWGGYHLPVGVQRLIATCGPPFGYCVVGRCAPVTVDRTQVRVGEGVSPAGLPTSGNGVGEVQVQFSGLVEDVNAALADFSLRYGAFDPWSAITAAARRSQVDVRVNVSDTGVGASAPLPTAPIHLQVGVATLGLPRILVRAMHAVVVVFVCVWMWGIVAEGFLFEAASGLVMRPLPPPTLSPSSFFISTHLPCACSMLWGLSRACPQPPPPWAPLVWLSCK